MVIVWRGWGFFEIGRPRSRGILDVVGEGEGIVLKTKNFHGSNMCIVPCQKGQKGNKRGFVTIYVGIIVEIIFM